MLNVIYWTLTSGMMLGFVDKDESETMHSLMKAITHDLMSNGALNDGKFEILSTYKAPAALNLLCRPGLLATCTKLKIRFENGS